MKRIQFAGTWQWAAGPAAVALLLAAAGCGIVRTGEPVYAGSEEVAPIQVPEDLSEPPVRQTFNIPGHSLPELAAQGDEALPPQVQPSSEAERSRSRIKFGATGLYLEVDDQADSVFRRLGYALNRGGMSITEADPGDSRYRFAFRHDPIVHERGIFARAFFFWRSADVTDYSGEYLVEVLPDSDERARVALLDPSGDVLRMERAEFVLARLRERLG